MTRVSGRLLLFDLVDRGLCLSLKGRARRRRKRGKKVLQRGGNELKGLLSVHRTTPAKAFHKLFTVNSISASVLAALIATLVTTAWAISGP